MDYVLYRGPSTEIIASIGPAGVIEPIIGVGVPHCPNHAWSDDNLLAFPVRKGRAVHVWTVDGHARRLAVIETPIAARDVIWCGNRLVIGGLDDEKPRVWVSEFDAEISDWQPLEMPVELLRARKGVDALAYSTSTLVAIDNIMMPKWAASYDVTVSGVPTLVRCTQLDPNGTYEHIVRASSGTDAFTVFSTTVGRVGSHRHLTLYRFKECEWIGRVVVGREVLAFEMDGDELVTLAAGETPGLKRYAVASFELAESASVDVPAPEVVNVPDGTCQLRKSLLGTLVVARADGSKLHAVRPAAG